MNASHERSVSRDANGEWWTYAFTLSARSKPPPRNIQLENHSPSFHYHAATALFSIQRHHQRL